MILFVLFPPQSQCRSQIPKMRNAEYVRAVLCGSLWCFFSVTASSSRLLVLPNLAGRHHLCAWKESFFSCVIIEQEPKHHQNCSTLWYDVTMSPISRTQASLHYMRRSSLPNLRACLRSLLYLAAKPLKQTHNLQIINIYIYICIYIYRIFIHILIIYILILY